MASTSPLGGSSALGIDSSTAYPEQQIANRLICFSVFCGCPGLISGTFDLIRFNASVPDHLLRDQPVDNTSHASLLRRIDRLQQLQQTGIIGEKLAVFPIILKLIVEYGDEILQRQKGGCAVCHLPAQSFVHRPICVTENGWLEVSDFTWLYKMMLSSTDYTSDIKSLICKYRDIADFPDDKQYLCAIVAPVCGPETECHQLITKNIMAYVECLCKDGLHSTGLQEAFEAKLDEVFEVSRWSSSSSDEDEGEDEDGNEEGGEDHKRQSNKVKGNKTAESNSQSTPRPTEMCTQSRDEDCEITASIFVGRPLLRIMEPPPRGCLSCLVFTSTFPKHTLPNSFKNKADMAIDCCRVLASIEEEIISSNEYRCATCSELFVKGRWTFPETELVFGSEKHAHIFDFAVPICAPGTICEDVARIAAREFIKLVLPEGLHMQFPGLDPDVDLPSLRDGLGWARNDSQLVLQKMGTQGFMDEEADRGEDPRDDTLTIAKLRRWHEICFNEELAKRRFLRENGYRRAGDIADSESSNTEAEPDCWITTDAEHTDGSVPLEQSPTSPKLLQIEDVKTALHNRPLPPLPTLDDLQEAYQSRPLPPLPDTSDEEDEITSALGNRLGFHEADPL